MIRKIIVNLLKNSSSINTLVGTRIYPRVVPPGVSKPAIAYQVISESRGYQMDGQTGLTNTRMQLTIVAESVSQMDTLAEACRQVLSGYRGTVNGKYIHIITLANEYDGAAVEGENLVVLRQDYQIKWKER